MNEKSDSVAMSAAVEGEFFDATKLYGLTFSDDEQVD